MKYLSSVILALTLFSIGCGHYLESTANYTPPSLKSEPRLFYPMDALEKMYTGTPRVILLISKRGTVIQASIIKSSGVSVLDSAALEYSRNFSFIPAKRDGEPVGSRMAMDIRFEFSNQQWDASDYVEDVLDLYSQISQAIPEDRNALEKEVLAKHNEYVDKMKDLMNYNHFISMVLLPDIYAEWKNDWNKWPLSFLLYHDFIQRFPDYKDLDAAKKELKNSLTNDIQYIKSTDSQSRVLKIEKEILLSKIKKLVENKYPGMINEIGLEVKIDSLSAF